MESISYSIIKSPVDELLLVANRSALIGMYFEGYPIAKHWTRDPNHPILEGAAAQLKEYFAGKRKTFSLPIHFDGTDFQNAVWSNIAKIPYGETITYSDLARQAGSPDAVRAAGASTGRNPISIIVPCHRVMGKNGSLTGFGGGLPRKRYLLNLENANSPLLSLGR